MKISFKNEGFQTKSRRIYLHFKKYEIQSSSGRRKIIPGENLDPHKKNEEGLTIKRNRPLIHSAWMNLNYHLSKRSQTQKTTYYMVLFIRNLIQGKTIATKSSSIVAKDWGGMREHKGTLGLTEKFYIVIAVVVT